MDSISGTQLVAILKATQCVPQKTIDKINRRIQSLENSDGDILQTLTSNRILSPEVCDQVQTFLSFLEKKFPQGQMPSESHTHIEFDTLSLARKKDIIFARQAIADSLCSVEDANKCFVEQYETTQEKKREVRIGQIMIKNRLVSGDRYVKINREVEEKIKSADLNKFIMGDSSLRLVIKNSLITLNKASIPEYFGPFRIIEEVARGGMGVIYKAWDAGLRRCVAIKVLKAWEHPPIEEIQRFHREARLAASLNHSNIVKIHGAGEVDGVHYFTMDFVEGKTLHQLLQESTSLSEQRALVIVREIALALEYAHSKDVVHRDVKPGNIMLDKSDRVLLADFGLAKGTNSESVHLTKSGDTIGTPAYMSPEQAQGETEVDGRSDIYSLGAVLYEMTTGKRPFEGSSVGAIISDVISKELLPPSKINPNQHPDVEKICLKAMAKNPSQRYSTAQELADDIERFLSGDKILAKKTGTLQRFWKKFASNSHLIIIVFILLSLLLFTGGRIFLDHQKADRNYTKGLQHLHSRNDNKALEYLNLARENSLIEKKIAELLRKKSFDHIKKGITSQTSYSEQKKRLETRKKQYLRDLDQAVNSQERESALSLLNDLENLKVKNFANLITAIKHFKKALFWFPSNEVAQKFLAKIYENLFLESKIHPWKKIRLFSLPLKIKSYLSKKMVSGKLLEHFTKNHQKLSPTNTIEELEPDTWWLIRDGENRYQFCIVRANNELQVYREESNFYEMMLWNYYLRKYYTFNREKKRN